MRRADLGDVHLQTRVLADEHAGRARVVEVDVREQQVAQIGDGEPALVQDGPERVDVRGRPAVEQRRPVVGLEQVAADHALVPEVKQVERLDGHGDRSVVRGRDRSRPLTVFGLLVGPVRGRARSSATRAPGRRGRAGSSRTRSAERCRPCSCRARSPPSPARLPTGRRMPTDRRRRSSSAGKRPSDGHRRRNRREPGRRIHDRRVLAGIRADDRAAGAAGVVPVDDAAAAVAAAVRRGEAGDLPPRSGSRRRSRRRRCNRRRRRRTPSAGHARSRSGASPGSRPC